MAGRRQAPKRLINEIRRRGTYGNIKYEHVLECGHIEIAVRASRAKKIACSRCLRLEETNSEIPKTFAASVLFDNDDDEATAEIEISRVRASLASILKVPVDAVEIVANQGYGVLEIRAAYVFLSAREISRLLSEGEDSGNSSKQ
jgi:hypothetical protein